MTGGNTMGERLASVEEWAEGHEKRCDDRQQTLGREIREMKAAVGGLTKGAWAIVIAFAGWAALQLYSNLKTGDVAQFAYRAGIHAPR